MIRVAPPLKTPGDCGVTGDVVRIFRDRRATLKMGTRLAFTVSCARRGDPPIVGGTIWKDYDRLMNAKYLEVFLNQADGRYEVALWQSRIIEGPTAEPAFDAPPNIGVATMETDGTIITPVADEQRSPRTCPLGLSADTSRVPGHPQTSERTEAR